MRIRRGIVTLGSQVAGMANADWDDKHEFDRSKSDDQWSGVPIEMNRAGSGTLEFLSGGIPTGYGTSSMVVTFYVITQSNGVETVSTKTATFTDVTFNRGHSIPAEGPGKVKVAFDYSTCTVA